MRRVLANYLLFQLVYLACVLGAAEGWRWLGPLAGLALLPLNLLGLEDRGREVRVWLIALGTGCAVDSLLVAAGVIAFVPSSQLAPAYLVPLWIVTLWLAVGTLLRASLAWLGAYPLWAALLGAVGGPLSFWSGGRLGVTALPSGPSGYLLLALEYAVLLPILLHLARDRDDDTQLANVPNPSCIT